MCSLLRNTGKNFLKKIESNIEEKLKEKKDWYTTKSEDDAIFNMFRGAVIQSTHNKKLIKELNRLMKKEEDENNQHGRVK